MSIDIQSDTAGSWKLIVFWFTLLASNAVLAFAVLVGMTPSKDHTFDAVLFTLSAGGLVCAGCLLNLGRPVSPALAAKRELRVGVNLLLVFELLLSIVGLSDSLLHLHSL